MNKVRILQLSDIHWIVKPRALDKYQALRDALIRDLKQYCETRDEMFDHLLICGDIAQSGSSAEYDKAKEFINLVCKTVGCNESEVYVVPGNHDKDRNAGDPILRRPINAGLAYENCNDKMFHDLTQKSAEFVCSMYKPFFHYESFSQTYENSEPLMHKCLHESEKEDFSIDVDNDEMFWCSPLTEDLSGYTLYLYGFNTALTCDENDFNTNKGHKMFLSKFAYNNILAETGKHIRMSMMHHPLDFLSDKDEIAKKLNRLFSVQLYGHVHCSESKQDVEYGPLKVYSGAIQPPEGGDKDKYCPVYNMMELSVKEGANDKVYLGIKLTVHKWNEDAESFQKNEEASDTFSIDITEQNRWAKQVEVETNKLPKGITKRIIRINFIDRRDGKQIIDFFYPDLYDTTQTVYMNNQRFLEKIRIDNLWVELWNKIKN